jgi:hypothetical protein
MKKDSKKKPKKAKSRPHSAEAELEALREQVRKLESSADAVEKNDGGITKRAVVQAAWAAPVILAINLPKGVFAQSALSPVSTPAPTQSPAAPTAAPTASPAAPTAAPTAAPITAPG